MGPMTDTNISEQVVKLLHRFGDPEGGPCLFDHHGYCQEHSGQQEPGDCPMAKANELFAKYPDWQLTVCNRCHEYGIACRCA